MSAQPRPLPAWFTAQTPRRHAALVQEVGTCLRDLLDLGDAFTRRTLRVDAGTFDEVRSVLASALDEHFEWEDYPYYPDATRALVKALTRPTDPDDLLGALVEDVAEILVLPRRDRTEYVTNRLDSPPWQIRKLLLEYAIRGRAIDDLVGAFNKGFCANACDQLPVGCCHILGYDLGLVPEAMLEVQDLEAQWRASGGLPWSPPGEREVERKCRYHTDAGCVLARFKSPACIGYLCNPLMAHLEARYSAALLFPFIDALTTFRNQDLDRHRIFECMEGVLQTGQALLATHVTGV